MTEETEKVINALKRAYEDSEVQVDLDTLRQDLVDLRQDLVDLKGSGLSFIEIASEYVKEVLKNQDEIEEEPTTEVNLEDLLKDTCKGFKAYFSDITQYLTRDDKLDIYHAKNGR